ncbi:MAG: hypothetical protein AVDCRST_MAG16-808, partial [uncultured Frankineae bacterium]
GDVRDRAPSRPVPRRRGVGVGRRRLLLRAGHRQRRAAPARAARRLLRHGGRPADGGLGRLPDDHPPGPGCRDAPLRRLDPDRHRRRAARREQRARRALGHRRALRARPAAAGHLARLLLDRHADARRPRARERRRGARLRQPRLVHRPAGRTGRRGAAVRGHPRAGARRGGCHRPRGRAADPAARPPAALRQAAGPSTGPAPPPPGSRSRLLGRLHRRRLARAARLVRPRRARRGTPVGLDHRRPGLGGQRRRARRIGRRGPRATAVVPACGARRHPRVRRDDGRHGSGRLLPRPVRRRPRAERPGGRPDPGAEPRDRVGRRPPRGAGGRHRDQRHLPRGCTARGPAGRRRHGRPGPAGVSRRRGGDGHDRAGVRPVAPLNTCRDGEHGAL